MSRSRSRSRVALSQGYVVKNLFSWGKPKEVTKQPMYKVIPPGEKLDRLKAYSEHILGVLRSSAPATTYGAAAVERLSDVINGGRLGYDEAAQTKIANLYGCFLGTSLIETYKAHHPRWIESDDGMGIVFAAPPGAVEKIAFPITRVFKQIEQGNVSSIHAWFLAIPEFIASNPRR